MANSDTGGAAVGSNEMSGDECTVHAPVAPTRTESRTRWVVGVTAVTMVVEIAVGWLSNSLALLADGWHMATHVGALGLSAAAYWYARTRAHERSFVFGTGKVYALAGYTSAWLLAAVAVGMAVSAFDRFLNPRVVDFYEAMPVAVIGLLINLACAWLLGSAGHEHGPGHEHGAGRESGANREHDASREHGHDHEHGHDQEHGHDHDHQHGRDQEHGRPRHEHGPGAPGSTRPPADHLKHDHAHRAAYLHVVADAVTSVAAIVAIGAGKLMGWAWADPAVALLGSVMITRWSFGLIAESSRQLIDLDPSTQSRDRIRVALEALPGTRVEDLHLWRVGPSRWVCVVAVVTDAPRSLDDYRAAVRAVVPVEHLTVEVRCPPGARA